MPYLYSIVCGMLCFCNGKGAADLDFRYCITVDHLPPTFLHASGLLAFLLLFNSYDAVSCSGSRIIYYL